MLSVFLPWGDSCLLPPISWSSRGRPTSSNLYCSSSTRRCRSTFLPYRQYSEYGRKSKENLSETHFIYKRYLMSQNTVRKTWKVREGVLAALWAAGGGWVGGRGGWLTPETTDTRLLKRAEGILFLEMTCAVFRSNGRSVCFSRAQLHQ